MKLQSRQKRILNDFPESPIVEKGFREKAEHT